MSEHDDGLARLLASPTFRRCRARASELGDDADGLRDLLRAVEGKSFGTGVLTDLEGGLDVDIACAVVEAHLEEISDHRRWGRGPVRADARQRLIVAALLYLVMEHDVIPDFLPHGHVDDVAVMRWATQVARGEVAVS